MEELGGLVVTDSLCFGSRSFWEPVQVPLVEQYQEAIAVICGKVLWQGQE